MHNTHALEGITLASFAFQENSHILSVFSKEYGRIKCVVKGTKKMPIRGLGPLLGVEMQVIVSDKELWKCPECIVTTSYPHLRKTLEALRYGAEISLLLDRLLPLHHPVPNLYGLFSSFLSDMPSFEKPCVAACTFLEKFLVAEGMLEKETGPENMDLGYYQKLIRII